jgi:hypothetical protein
MEVLAGYIICWKRNCLCFKSIGHYRVKKNMKIYLLVFIIAFSLVIGCKYSPEPPFINKLGSTVTITSPVAPILYGGGRWFTGKDTGTWYDLDAGYSLENSYDKGIDVAYTIVIGEYKNERYQSPNGDLFFDKDSLFTGMINVPAHSTKTINIEQTIGIGRRNNSDWSYPYGFHLSFLNVETKETVF